MHQKSKIKYPPLLLSGEREYIIKLTVVGPGAVREALGGIHLRRDTHKYKTKTQLKRTSQRDRLHQDGDIINKGLTKN